MRLTIILAIGCIAALASCSSDQQAGNYQSKSDTTIAAPAMDAGNTTKMEVQSTPPLPSKKVILTADYNCNVKDVFASVKALELLVKEQGGVIQESSMDNTKGEMKSVEKGDSIIQYHTYNTVATLVLRVPSSRFDTVVHAIPSMAQFIDTRTVRESDVTLQFYSNTLRQEASRERLNEIKNITTEKKDALAIAGYKDQKQESKINHEINNLQLQGDVAYATIAVKFTQPQQVFAQTIMNPETLTASRFSDECKDALGLSFNLLRIVALALLTMWPLIVVVAALFFAVKAYRLRFNKVKVAP